MPDAGDIVLVSDIDDLVDDVDEVLAGRAPVVEVSTTTSSAAIGTTATEVSVLPSFTYQAGKAYRVKLEGGVAHSTTTNASGWSVKKSNGAGTGTLLMDWPRVPALGTTLTCGIPLQERYFTVGASNVTTALCLVIASTAGATVTHAAAAAYPRGIKVFEAGSAADFPNDVVLS